MFGFFKRRPKGPPDVLLWLADGEPYTLTQAYQSTLLIGESGSGKTSSFDHILLALLRMECPERGGKADG